MTTALLLFGSMALFILIGVPIAFALGAAVWSTIVFSPDFTVTVGIIAQRIFGGLESTSIMAIPFFILAGNLMTKGGISRRLVNFANCIVGNVRGGMALALVLACAFFAALSGSAPATVIAIGSMLYPEMVRMGYPKDRTAGLLVVSGGLGLGGPEGYTLLEELARRLLGCPLRREDLLARLEGVKVSRYFSGLTAEGLADLLPT